MRTLALIAALVTSLAACLVETEQPRLEGHDIKVTFVHTSDIHSRLVPYYLDVGETDESYGLNGDSPVGGASRITTIVKGIRAGGGRVIHVDTGDIFQGAPIFNQFKGEVEFKWFSMLGVDAFVVGNHEFDAGIKNFITQAEQFARFPMLNANYGMENPNVFGASQLGRVAQPFTIVNVQGLRVGIIGLGSLSSIVSMYDGGNSLGVTPLDTVQVTQFWVDFLRPQVDVVMVASHLGLRAEKKMVRGSDDTIDECEGTDCTIVPVVERCEIVDRLLGDEGLIANTEGIDLVLGGHLHIVINPPEEIVDCTPSPACKGYPHYENLMSRGCQYRRRVVPLMHSGAFAKYVGQLDTIFHKPGPDPTETTVQAGLRELNRWEVKTYRAMLHPVDARVPLQRYDVATERLLEPYKSELYRKIQLTRFIAYAPRTMRRFSTGWGDSQLGNLVAASMQTKNRVEAQFAVTNTLGIRADINRGPITEEMMYNVFPFENSITTMVLSGDEVKILADYVALRSARRGCQTQAQISGVTMVFNCNEDVEAAQRVTIGGARLDEPERYGLDAERKPRCTYDGLRCTPGTGGNCNPDFEPAKICPEGTTLGEGGCCPQGQLCTPVGCGTPISPYVSYKLAANDYIAAGGSGFTMLQNNTTQFNTGISLRDGVMDFVNINFPGCGAGLPPETLAEIDELNNAVFEAEPSAAAYEAVVAQIKVFFGVQNVSGFADYGSCLEDIGMVVERDCESLPNPSTERSHCRAEAWARSAEQCVELPCVSMDADGRIDRIFPEQ
jgi:5'-nucleotidase